MGLARCSRSPRFSPITFTAVISVALFSFGCGGGSSVSAPPPQAQGMHGQLIGGQQPVVGASVQLYAAGVTGYGSQATPLGLAVTTTSGGAFTLGTYVCPSGTSQSYIVATGGNSGSGTNGALAMMAALGNCGDLNASTFIVINERSTVAAVYALAPYMTATTGTLFNPGSSLGGTATTLGTQGISNAFLTVKSLVATATAKSPGLGLPGNGTVPVAQINTLANVLAGCVNSDGTGPGCTNLFTDTTPPGGGTVPANTLDAMLNIAKYPGQSVSAICALGLASAPFQPAIDCTNTPPNDWTLGIKFTGGGLASPHGMAVDAAGNVWVANNTASTISEFSPIGAALSGSGFADGGLSGPFALAIDTAGPPSGVWLSNFVSDDLSEFDDSNGSFVSGVAGFLGGGLDGPLGIAVDGGGNIWLANEGHIDDVAPEPCNCVSEFDSMGNNLSPDATGGDAGGFTGGGVLSAPSAVAADAETPTQHVWVANSGNDTLTELNATDGSFAGGASGGGLSNPRWIAIDGSGNVWNSNFNNDSISKFNSTGADQSAGSGFTGGGLDHPYGIAVDGLNNIWVANNGTTLTPGHSVSEFDNSGNPLSPSTGYTGGAPTGTILLTIDGSGNVWLASGGDNSIVELVGAAAPVVTPLAAASNPLAPLLGSRP